MSEAKCEPGERPLRERSDLRRRPLTRSRSASPPLDRPLPARGERESEFAARVVFNCQTARLRCASAFALRAPADKSARQAKRHRPYSLTGPRLRPASYGGRAGQAPSPVFFDRPRVGRFPFSFPPGVWGVPPKRGEWSAGRRQGLARPLWAALAIGRPCAPCEGARTPCDRGAAPPGAPSAAPLSGAGPCPLPQRHSR